MHVEGPFQSAPPVDRSSSTSPRRDASDLAEIAHGSTVNLAGSAVFALSALAVTVLVARAFSRPVAGAFFTATSLFLILEAIAGLGAPSGLVYFVARLRARGDDGMMADLFRAAFVPVIVSSFTLAALLGIFARPLAQAFLSGRRLDGASASAVADTLRALAAALPLAALLDVVLGASRGFRDMRPTAIVDRVGRASLQFLGVLVATSLGAAALLGPLWAMAYLPAATVAWRWLRRISRRPPREKQSRREGSAAGDSIAGSFWRFTLPRALATVGQIVIQRLDIVLVGIMRGPVEAAVYTAATRFLVLGQLGNAAIAMASQPQLSYLFARHDHRAASTVYQTTTGWLILLTWPVYLIAIIYGPALLGLFGHSYRSGTTVTVILGSAMLLATSCGQVDVVLTSTGRSGLSLANGILAVGVNIAVDLVLIPAYGIMGAAMGWAAAIVVSNALPLIQVARTVQLHPAGTGTMLAWMICALCFGALPLLMRTIFGGGGGAAVAGIASGCVAFAVALRRFRRPLRLALLPSPRRRGGSLLSGLVPPEVT